MLDRLKVLIIYPMSSYLGKDFPERVGAFRDPAELLHNVVKLDAVLILYHPLNIINKRVLISTEHGEADNDG